MRFLTGLLLVAVVACDRGGVEQRLNSLETEMAAVRQQLQERAPRGGGALSGPLGPVSVEGAVANGSDGAKVVLIEYSDFQCPGCRVFANQTLPFLEKEFVSGGQLRFVFRELPLETIHPTALAAAVVASCAGEQGRFWEAHKKLFEVVQLDVKGLDRITDDLRLGKESLRACIDGTTRDRIREEAAEARRLGITGTPTFLLGVPGEDGKVAVRRRINGAAPLSVFRSAIEELLSADARSTPKTGN
jgi:protein-disulfide isomerase